MSLRHFWGANLSQAKSSSWDILDTWSLSLSFSNLSDTYNYVLIWNYRIIKFNNYAGMQLIIFNRQLGIMKISMIHKNESVAKMLKFLTAYQIAWRISKQQRLCRTRQTQLGIWIAWIGAGNTCTYKESCGTDRKTCTSCRELLIQQLACSKRPRPCVVLWPSRLSTQWWRARMIPMA